MPINPAVAPTTRGGEAPEVGVGRADRRLMLDGERGEVHVGAEVPSRSRVDEQRSNKDEVAIGRCEKHGLRTTEPAVDEIERPVGRERSVEHPPAGADAHEGEQGHPRERSGFVAVERASNHVRPTS